MTDRDVRMAGMVHVEESNRLVGDPLRSRFSALLLAGGLQPSPLRETLRLPALCLPLARDETLLDRWIALLLKTPGCHRIVILVSTFADQQAIEAALMDRSVHSRADDESIEVRIDPRKFRGPSGLARDLIDDLGLRSADYMLIVEAACMPPLTLAPMFDAIDDEIAGVIGSSTELEPAGVYLFRRTTLEQIPKVGFHDLKEQTLPMLYANGQRCRMARIVPGVRRLRDRVSYLTVVGEERLSAERRVQDDGVEALLSPSARVAGTCLVCDDVVVEDGAVLHESVVLNGAVVGGGAVISRSVVGPGVRVAARSIVRSEVLSGSGAAGDETVRRRVHRTVLRPGGHVNGVSNQQLPLLRGREDVHG